MPPSSRDILGDRTNESEGLSERANGKRTIHENGESRKRLKVDKDWDILQVGEQQQKNLSFISHLSGLRSNDLGIYGVLKARRMGDPSFSRQPISFSTLHILESFVSSHRTDIYRCQSISADVFLSPPYACAYSNASKRGQSTHIAVATEDGNVHILDTKRRGDWESEPSRSTYQVHGNGIFDVKWSPHDRFIATGSGDHSVRIINPSRSTSGPLYNLRGHTSTVKCVAWDPSHQDLLASAGRDGSICIWDLRERHKFEMNSREMEEETTLLPVLRMPYAHEPIVGKATKKGRTLLAPRSITSLVYSPSCSHEIISSGSYDGVLRKWDVRNASTSSSPSKRKSKKAMIPLPTEYSWEDLTMIPSPSSSIRSLTSSPRRARGISSLALGCGPTAGQIFALANDSKIRTYNFSGAAGLAIGTPQESGPVYSHRHMSTNSFYVRISTSPCGRWLACGGASGSAFIFDVGERKIGLINGIELKGQEGEVGALDWAEGSLATCADDGTVRIWRPDYEVHGQCVADPVKMEDTWSWGRS